MRRPRPTPWWSSSVWRFPWTSCWSRSVCWKSRLVFYLLHTLDLSSLWWAWPTPSSPCRSHHECLSVYWRSHSNPLAVSPPSYTTPSTIPTSPWEGQTCSWTPLAYSKHGDPYSSLEVAPPQSPSLNRPYRQIHLWLLSPRAAQSSLLCTIAIAISWCGYSLLS